MRSKIIFADLFNRSIAFKNNRRLQKLVLAVALFLAIYIILVIFSMPARFDLAIGRPSSQTIFAPRDVIDEYTTSLLREGAAQMVPNAYDYDPLIVERAINELTGFFDKAIAIQANDKLDQLERPDQLESLQLLIPGDVPLSTISALLTDSATMRDLQGRLNTSISEIFQSGIREGEEDLIRRRLNQEIALYPFSADLKRIAEVVVKPLVEQNMTFNAQVTENNREQARSQIEPVMILRGTRIVSEGEPVTEQQLSLLEDLGLIRGQRADYAGYIGLFLLLVIIFIVIGIYLSIFVPDVYRSPKLLFLMGLIFVITLLLAAASTYFSGYLIPVATGAILTTVIFGYKPALMINMVMALMVGLITGGDYTFVLIALFGGLVSIYAVTRLSQRSDLARAGFYVALTNAGIIISNYLFLGNMSLEIYFLRNFSYDLVAGIGSGIFSSVVAIGLLPFLESLFNVTTAITLLELSNPNHPLLREMLMRAPGTYYHSMMVSNLAETAAERVNANYLLARVGAYYHDIGKLKRPFFFSENQLSGENPHARLSPNLSVLIIGSHPKDGVELGRRHRLPEVIMNIALQHHGTSMISFFYLQALEDNTRNGVVAENFRYDGPKPHSKEAAIIMLADAIEAGVRSLSDAAGNKVEQMIRRMIREKIEDGQLEQCDLTLSDIEKITQAFIYIMSGIYHSRIEYPENVLRAEIERSKAAK